MKKFVSFAALIIITCNIFALEKIKISLTPGFGLMSGQIQEYVFMEKIKGFSDDYLESRLDWDMKPLWFFSLKTEATFLNHIYLGLEGKAGLPGVTGKMIDNDWLNFDPKNNYQTNYSEHTNFLNHYINGKITLGGIITFPVPVYIMPAVSFLGQEFFFTGKNGFLRYGQSVSGFGHPYFPYDDANPDHVSVISMEGRDRIITYIQDQYVLFFGVKTGSQIGSRMRIDVSFEYSPYTFISANDVHYETDSNVAPARDSMNNITDYDRDYLDEPKGFGTWNLEGEFTFMLNEKNMIGLKTSYYYIPVLKGKDGIKKRATGKYILEGGVLGGASSSMFSVQLLYTFRI